MLEALRWPVVVLAGIGFLLSLAVHVASIDGVDVEAAVPWVWALHVGIFVVFPPVVLSLNRRLGAGVKPRLRDFNAMLPKPVAWAYYLLGTYAVLNFLLSMNHLAGSPTLRDGHYLLMSHGRVVAEIDAAQYTAAQANMTRSFSGHWLVFYFLPFAYFAFANPPGRRDADKA